MNYEDREDLDLFEMANIYPKNTGLPMTVWVSPRGHAKHAAPHQGVPGARGQNGHPQYGQRAY